MDLSFLPSFVQALGNVPESLQTGILLLIAFGIYRVSGLLKYKYQKWRANGNGEKEPAPSTRMAVEELRNELLPLFKKNYAEIDSLKTEVGNHLTTAIEKHTEAIKENTDTLRDLKEQDNRVANTMNVILGKMDNITTALARIEGRIDR